MCAYQHINNLYKDQTILRFKEVFALEKIHGTSAHISYTNGNINFFAGGSKHETFIKLFDQEALEKKFSEMGLGDTDICIYGEAYGGKLMGMSATYGPDLKFVAFEVKIGDTWLNVPKAEVLCKSFGLEFVHYVKISTDIESIDRVRDADSFQAVKNGMGTGHMREGIVLHPLEEFTKNNGERVIAKHKRDEFKETKTPRNLIDKSEKLLEINKIIDEWLTESRLNHILNGEEIELKIENIGKVIILMKEDIYREAKGEIEESKELEKAIGRETALMFKRRLNENIKILL